MTDPCRAALAELVEIDDLRIAINASKVVDGHRVLFFLSATEADKARAEVSQRFPAAWAAARSALAQEAVPPRVPMEQVREWADRHDLGISSDTSLRDIFDDARTLVAQHQDTKDQI